MTGDEAAIRQALLDYGASFTAFDVARIANHFHDPCTLVTAQGVRALVGPAAIRETLTALVGSREPAA